ncbi:hypothetical protein OIDMADRAFT_54931 [Oidiodendron maius Zn]|uniref:Uncharacterized protein n=1 Tax=Oidiodendron maius (strain Zn) TaxID=913774 RepID=A0A0C3CMV6_OIDMZ|nr:hypothetical protein OIDMADRAFT_54931 [Oidiodendron maius Zn]
MSCTQIRGFVSKVKRNCLETLGLKQKNYKTVNIGSPFNFQQGPPVDIPGFAEYDISLLREKAIASTAIANDNSNIEINTGSACFKSYSLNSRAIGQKRRDGK